jgi:DNA-binding transcriptional ArsR family regulator
VAAGAGLPDSRRREGSALCPDALNRAEPAADSKLAALLGRTRAAVLETVSSPCTASELARQTGISLASASQHATVLREAGLLTTTRHRNAVMHTTTALGAALLGRPDRAAGGRVFWSG